MTSLQMSALGLGWGNNGVLLHGSSPAPARWYSNSSKPLFCMSFNTFVVRKRLVFDVSKPRFEVTGALANGELEARPSAMEFLEKELKFTPSFDDYVKVMESVRTDRGASGSEGVDGHRSGRRPAKRDGKMKDFNDGKGFRKKKNGEGGWGLVEGILEKRSIKRNDGDRRERKNSRMGRDDDGERELVNQSSFVERKSRGSRVDKDAVENIRGVKFNKSESVGNAFDSRGRNSVGREILGKRGMKRNDADFRERKNSRMGSIGDGERELVNQSRFEERKSRSSRVNKDAVENIRGVKFNKAESGGNAFDSRGRNIVGGEIIEMRSMKRNEVDFRERNNSLMGRDDDGERELVNQSCFGEKKTRSSLVYKDQVENNRGVKFNKAESGGNAFDSRGRNIDDGVHHASKGRIGKGQLENSMSSLKGGFSTRENVVRKSEELVSSPSATVNGYAAEAEKLASKATGVYSRSGKDGARLHTAAWRNINDDDFEDRAAFKTFEVFTDINNRPRVLRMELEERIKKLAMWLNATDVNMPEWQFSKMIHSAKIKFTDHSILRMVQILGDLGNWKRVLQVVEWLQSRERFKSYKSRYIYTSVLDVLGKARRPIEALNVFHLMRQKLSSYPDMAAYHCIAVTLGQAGLMKELFDVIDCMKTLPKKKFDLGPLQKWDPRVEPDLVIYNAVLNACVQQKQWEGAFWVLQQLKIQHLKPSNTTYGLVMEVMLACGKYNLVHEVFRKLEKNSIPSALNYKVLVNTLWREGKVDEAVLAVHDMESRGIVGTASLYYDLARCLCSAGRCEEALLQIDKICKVAKKPLVVTYTGLIQTCLDAGSVENGTYIFKQMQKFCSPNTVTYNIMLKSYIEHGMLDTAIEVFQNMLDRSRQIISKTDSRQAVVPDKFTFNTMIEACAEAKNWDDFENIYGQMLHHGFYFDKKRHLRLVLDAFRAGKAQVLEITWDHLVRFGRVPPPPIIKERFCLKLQDGEFLAAISCIDTHPVTDINNTFSQKSWLILLKNNANRFNVDTVTRLEHEVSNFLANTNQPHHIHQNLLYACREFLSCTTHVDNPMLSPNTLRNHQII